MGPAGPAGPQGSPGRDGKDAALLKPVAYRFTVVRDPTTNLLTEIIATPIERRS